MNQDGMDTSTRRFAMIWDTNTAVGVILIVALVLLIGIHVSFGGVVVEIGD